MPQRIETETIRNISRMPAWIRQPLGEGKDFGHTHAAIAGNQLHTVCEAARCPNRGECWSRGTATFMLLGDICTRACGFCSVKTGRPGAVDQDEPRRLADAVERMELNYVVLTSVNRDDQKDKGVGIFAATLRELRQRDATIGVEFLTPDFQGQQETCVNTIATELAQSPFTSDHFPKLVWGHNVETVPRLYRQARKGARYAISLRLLERAAVISDVETKSAIMLGLGETREEVLGVLKDLRSVGVDRISIGQYLRPSMSNLPVMEYVTPVEFEEYARVARALGFGWVKSGPLVRSSYHAEEVQSI
ncbi:MAG: lipoyl synthase [Acidiferrobacterales bacterium]